MTRQQDKERILVVDDSPATIEVIQRNLRSRGYTVITASCAAEAVETLRGSAIDLVITDYRMPGQSGMELVRHIRENHADVEVMMITGYATVEGAVEAVKGGAEEYLPKPFTADELFAAVSRALDKLQVRRAARSRTLTTPRSPHGIIGESEAMQQIYRMIAKTARSSATVLITGESGTGKELIARAIHYGGPRAASSFVAVNCGGIPEGLLESELFGYVKGAFTGAIETRAGFFQAADGGTIFLDEVGETSLAMQVKLLRVLQDKEVCMVGSTRAQPVDARILAATNKDLAAMGQRGLFREDLYYRLNVVSIELPPLRERGDDVLLLTNHFIAKYAADAERPVPRFTDAALNLLRRNHWSGNVRALENVIQNLLVMADGDVIDVPDFPPLMRCAGFRESGLDRSLAEVEAEHIRGVLASVDGNKTRAAEILGIDRKTLREKLRR
ncbi:MAG: sigma-54 dependent transcriptional regulator [Proteobacteria bacterium]|jgi:DNA-binding NtrC family response regulator|nr:sigma-54 dependent transcriptional regulator [Pseudomonadota bacterium]